MKRCPQCNRTYTDDALSFCLDDGSPLAAAGGPPGSDPGATVQYPQGRDTTPQPTIAFRPTPAAPPQPPPVWSPMPPLQPQKRSVWPWLLGIGAVLLFMGVGVVILIIALSSMGNNNNNNRNSNLNSRLANRNTNRNTNSELPNDNSSRSDLTSFSDDFSTESWGTGVSQFGRTWYDDDEYHMHATMNGYIVMYSPDKPEYHDENATVRVTVHSIDGTPPAKGYGLVVHGQKKDGNLEDYSFLISNGSELRYRIVEHKAGVETKLADWTTSSAIRGGTSPNQIEVRIRDLRMDLYINGQFITTVNDEAGYRRGRVGFYTTDTGEVAFDDLEVSK